MLLFFHRCVEIFCPSEHASDFGPFRQQGRRFWGKCSEQLQFQNPPSPPPKPPPNNVAPPAAESGGPNNVAPHFLCFSLKKPNLGPNNVAPPPQNGNGPSINCAPATLLGGFSPTTSLVQRVPARPPAPLIMGNVFPGLLRFYLCHRQKNV